MGKLDVNVLEGLVTLFLLPRYDAPQPIPPFHRTLWKRCCSDDPYIAMAAPRGNAKTSAVTHAYTIGSVLLGDRDFVLIVSDTETQAAQFLGDIKAEFQDNDALIKQFGIKKKFIKDTETDIIVQSMAGKFRIIAKGSEQKVRGLKWDNKRPNLILCHEENTRIFADGKWMLNNDHPTARKVKTSGYKITFEDGTTEVISKDHRYWIEGRGWVFAHELELDMEVGGCLTEEEIE
jgi:hypothetical protein